MNKLATIALTALVATTAIVGTARGAQAADPNCNTQSGWEVCTSQIGNDKFSAMVKGPLNQTAISTMECRNGSLTDFMTTNDLAWGHAHGQAFCAAYNG